MDPEVESLPPVRFSLGGRLWQLCIGVVFMVAAFALIFIDELPFKEAIAVLFPVSVYLLFLYWKNAIVTIYNDRVEFTAFRAELEVVKFSDITKVELERDSYRSPPNLYVTTRVSGKERRILLPNVFRDIFDPLKKYLQKWHGAAPQTLQAVSDHSRDRDVWYAPPSTAT